MSLVLVMGLPAAGKSSLCEKIRELRADAVVFSLDEIIGRWSCDFDAHSDRKTFEQTVRQYLETHCDNEFNKTVIVDDNFYLQSMRRPFERMARSFGLRYCCVLVDVDVEEALRRNSLRGEDRVHDETILKMAREIEIPSDSVVFTDGDIDVIFQRLRGPRPKRVQSQQRHLQREKSSILSGMDSLLRSAVADAVREGFDGRRLAIAKKIIMNRCRYTKCLLTERDIAEALREEYHKLEYNGS